LRASSSTEGSFKFYILFFKLLSFSVGVHTLGL